MHHAWVGITNRSLRYINNEEIVLFSHFAQLLLHQGDLVLIFDIGTDALISHTYIIDRCKSRSADPHHHVYTKKVAAAAVFYFYRQNSRFVLTGISDIGNASDTARFTDMTNVIHFYPHFIWVFYQHMKKCKENQPTITLFTTSLISVATGPELIYPEFSFTWLDVRNHLVFSCIIKKKQLSQ